MKLFKKVFTFILNVFLDIFYPKRCIICNCKLNIAKKICICSDCMPFLKSKGQAIRDTSKFFEEAVSPLEYEGNTKEWMREFKFRIKKYLGSTFSYAIYQNIKEREFIKTVSLICPVPIHPSRDREYNQSEVIAKGISNKFSIPLAPDMLLKISNIKPLSKMDFKLRSRMIKSAIEFNVKYNIEGKIVCLVDDIYTTGSTANECARILKMYGAQKVYVLSACHTPKKETGENENADTNIADK